MHGHITKHTNSVSLSLARVNWPYLYYGNLLSSLCKHVKSLTVMETYSKMTFYIYYIFDIKRMVA